MNDKSFKEMAEDIDRKIEDGSEFDDLVRVDAHVARQPRAVFSVRLSPEELSRFSAAARGSGMTLSDWIRAAGLAALENNEAPEKAAALDRIRHQVEELADSVRKL